MKIKLFVILTVFYLSSFSQQKETGDIHDRVIDSLIYSLNQSKTDTNKTRILLEVGNIFQNNTPDSAMVYFEKALVLSNKTGNRKNTARSLILIGEIHKNKGNYNLAENNNREALLIFQEMADSPDEATSKTGETGIYECYTNLGSIYRVRGSYNKAVEYFQWALKIAEESGNKKGIAQCNGNLGITYCNQGYYERSMEYFKKSLKLNEEIGYNKGISDIYANIGVIHWKQGDFVQAVEDNQKSLKIRTESGDKKGIAQCYTNIGFLYKCMKNYEMATKYNQKALSTYEELGDKNGLATVLGSIAELNMVFADSANGGSEKAEKYKKAIEFAERSLLIAKEMGFLLIENESYGFLSNAWSNLHDYKKAWEYSQKYIMTGDSLFNKEKISAIEEMEAKYQFEKKQKEIELQKIELEKNEMEITLQTKQKYGLFIGLLLMLILVMVIFRNYREKKKANIILTKKKEEIQNQAHQLAEKNTIITESINYAKLIQDAILPSTQLFNKLFPDSFIFYRPKDIVSGDFYWLYKEGEKIFIAVVDCTGHGVSGAFMSMIGITMLNEVVKEKQIHTPSKILKSLNEKIIYLLNQSGKSHNIGMDMTLCCIDKEKNVLTISLANRKAILFENKKVVNIKAGMSSIGNKLSTNQPVNYKDSVFSLENEIILYMFTDGYIDQFGGNESKKFGSPKFEDLIVDIVSCDFQKQGRSIDYEFERWKGSNCQTDDVLVIGINFNKH